MVKPILCALILALLALSAVDCRAQTVCSKASEFQPELCPIKLPRITSVAITENGARSSPTAEPNLDCTRFKLKSTQVRQYFSRARQLKDPKDSHHTLDWLPCYASGTLRLADGKTATWVIEQSQTARLTLSDAPEISLYCPRCKFTPFMW